MPAETFKQTNKVTKTNEPHQIIGGWMSQFEVWDSDEERINIDSYENTVIDFCKEARTFNVNHKGPPVGTLIDSLFIGSEEFAKQFVHEITGLAIEDIPIKKVGHYASVQVVDADLFEDIVENGCMFSIEGEADRVLYEGDE